MTTAVKNILVVCTGNTCRSPMGAAWLEHHFRKIQREEEFLVESCGIYAADGMGASEGAVERLQQEGIDLSTHRSRGVTKEMIENAYLIFCMSLSHERHLLQMVPEAENKVIVLHIDDPIGFGIQVYDQCFREIVKSLQAHMGRILEG